MFWKIINVSFSLGNNLLNYFAIFHWNVMHVTVTAETVQELDSNFQTTIDIMRNTDVPVTAVASGCELFLRFITFAKLDYKVR